MAVPKRKTSKARRDKRRASSYRLPKVALVRDPESSLKGFRFLNPFNYILRYNEIEGNFEKNKK